MKKIITCFFLIVVFFGYIKAADVFDSTNSVFSSDSTSLDTVQDITQSAAKTYNLDEYINTINSSVRENIGEDFNFKNMANEIINKNNINYKKIFMKLLDLFFKEISSAIKGAITIFIVVVIMAVLSNLELEKKSDITKIAHLACFIVIATITIASNITIFISSTYSHRKNNNNRNYTTTTFVFSKFCRWCNNILCNPTFINICCI